MKIFESYYETYKKGGDVVVGVYRMLTEGWMMTLMHLTDWKTSSVFH
jgi:hypothetical protein